LLLSSLSLLALVSGELEGEGEVDSTLPNNDD
jgi:hypothetical protein